MASSDSGAPKTSTPARDERLGPETTDNKADPVTGNTSTSPFAGPSFHQPQQERPPLIPDSDQSSEAIAEAKVFEAMASEGSASGANVTPGENSSKDKAAQGCSDSAESRQRASRAYGLGLQGFKMPRPGTAGAPFFTGNNILDFLESYEAAAEAAGITDASKVLSIVFYMDIPFQADNRTKLSKKTWSQAKIYLVWRYGAMDKDCQELPDDQIDQIVSTTPMIDDLDHEAAIQFLQKIDNIRTKAARRDLDIMTSPRIIRVTASRFNRSALDGTALLMGTSIHELFKKGDFDEFKVNLMNWLGSEATWRQTLRIAAPTRTPFPVPPKAPRGEAPPPLQAKGSKVKPDQGVKSLQSQLSNQQLSDLVKMMDDWKISTGRIAHSSPAAEDHHSASVYSVKVDEENPEPFPYGPRGQCWYAGCTDHDFKEGRCPQKMADKRSGLIRYFRRRYSYGPRNNEFYIPWIIVASSRQDGKLDREAIVTHLKNQDGCKATKAQATEILEQNIGRPWSTLVGVPRDRDDFDSIKVSYGFVEEGSVASDDEASGQASAFQVSAVSEQEHEESVQSSRPYDPAQPDGLTKDDSLDFTASGLAITRSKTYGADPFPWKKLKPLNPGKIEKKTPKSPSKKVHFTIQDIEDTPTILKRPSSSQSHSESRSDLPEKPVAEKDSPLNQERQEENSDVEMGEESLPEQAPAPANTPEPERTAGTEREVTPGEVIEIPPPKPILKPSLPKGDFQPATFLDSKNQKSVKDKELIDKLISHKLYGSVSLPVEKVCEIWPEYGEEFVGRMRTFADDLEGVVHMPVPTDFTDFAKTSKERAQQTDWVSEYNEIVQTQDCPKIFSVEAVVPTTVNWMAPTIVTPQLILKISVGGERPDDHSPVWGVIDTGAESSLVSYQYVLDHDIPISTTTLTMRTMAKGDPKLRFIGACHVPVWINNYKIMTTMMVVDPETVNHDLLLGLPFAVSAELTFKYSKRFVTAVMKAKDCRSGKFRKISIPVGLMRSDSLRQIQRHFPEWESYMKDVHNTSEAAQGQPKTDQDLGDTYDEVRTCYVNATMDYEKERLLAQERKEADLLEQKEAVSKTDQCSTPISPLAALDVLGTIAKAAVTPIMETIQACLLGNTKSQQNLPKVPKDWAFFESIRKDPKPDQGFISIYTMYKRKDKKVHPVDNLPSDGSVPDGQKDWKKILTREVEGYYQLSDSPFASYVHPRFAQFDRGTRLTPERFLKLKVAWPHLLPREIEMLEYILTNREGALAWDFTECGRVDPRVAPPQKIRTVPHVAWQEKGIPIPKALQGKVIDMLRSRVARGVLEESHGSYRNSWFLVAKKDGNMRLINSCTKLNKISIRDAFIPPGADEFSEDFADCEIMSLLDLFSGYDQVSLDESSRDLTTFATPLGLFRMCTLPQGATNSVAQFMRVVTRILYDLIPSVCRPFLDDIPVRGPRTTYNGDHVVELPGVRLYVFEHFMNLDTVLWNLELAGATISPEKSQICQPAVNLLGYVVGSGGRKPDQNKVIKILEWEKCDDVTAVKSLLGIVGFYRAWIKDCGTISAPLIRLLRKGVPFEWGLEQQLAMETLKLCLVSPPLLRPIDYEEEAGEIYLSTDASTKGWGAVLGQYYQGKRCVARYESGIWTGAALNYDAGKLELRSVLLALKRLRNYLYGVRFTLETDAKVLVDQISGAASDLPGAVLTRWITWIKMFDFDIRHVPGTKNGAADGLSRKPAGESDIQEAEQDEDLDEMIDNSIYVLEAEEDPRPRADDLLNPEQAWSRRSRQIAEYLASLSRPRTVSWINFKKFKLRAAKYVLRDGFLFQKGTKSNPTPRRVVDDEEEQKKLIWHAHTEGGHRGRDATYARLRERYAWENMYRMTSDAIKGCLPCAQARPRRFEDPHTFSTPPGIPFQHIYVDVQKIGNYSLAEARDALTGYVEARQLPKNVNSRMMAKFIWEDVICRHGIYGLLTVDGGPENKGFVKKLNRVYGGRRLVISAYNSKANGLVEKGHQPLIHALMTWSDFGRKNWTSVLHTALFADRTSVRSSTGYSPFYLVYGYNPITPIETKSVTWRVLDWSKVRDAETELLFRIRTFEQLDSDRQTALEYVAKRRRQVAEDYNRRNKYRMRHKELQVGDIVLVYDARLSIDKSSSGKLSARWLGPFRIRQISPRTSSYLLETLAGIPIERTVAGDRLKKFVVNEDGHLDDISEMEVRPDLEQALNKVFPAANQPDPDAPSPADILDPDELSALEEAETDDFNAMKAQIEQLQEQNKTLQAEVDAWQKKNEMVVGIPAKNKEFDNQYRDMEEPKDS